MVLTASFVLSPVTGLFATVASRIVSARLDASVGASGPHDFAVRKPASFVFRCRCVHRIPSRVRDDRETPLLSGRDSAQMPLIWVERKRFISSAETGRPKSA